MLFRSNWNPTFVRIWNPTLQIPDWSSFPDPLLDTHREDARRGHWLLPSILTSAGLAMCEFGKTGNLAVIQPYLLLKYFGREVTTKKPNRDDWDIAGSGDKLPTGKVDQAEFLKNWIENGIKPSESHMLLDALESKLKSNKDRREALLATVDELRKQYSEVWKEFANQPWHKVPETWELREDIQIVLDDIYDYVFDSKPTMASTVV